MKIAGLSRLSVILVGRLFGETAYSLKGERKKNRRKKRDKYFKGK